MPDTNLTEATHALTRLQRELTKRFFLHDNEKVLITFSAGVTEVLAEDDQTSVVNRADTAMYQAKQSGKNRVIAHEAGGNRLNSRLSRFWPHCAAQFIFALMLTRLPGLLAVFILWLLHFLPLPVLALLGAAWVGCCMSLPAAGDGPAQNIDLCFPEPTRRRKTQTDARALRAARAQHA